MARLAAGWTGSALNMRRGEIYIVDLDPTTGGEQYDRRPVFVVSSDAFNRSNPPIVCPVTGGGLAARYAGFAVSLQGTGLSTTGVVLCNQVRTLDLKARKAKRMEMAPPNVVQDVLAVLQDIFEP